MYLAAKFVDILVQVLVIVIIADAILSYFVDPYHPIRKFTGSVVSPMLDPIRRVVPNVGMFDFSPLILLIIVQVLGGMIVRLLNSL